jgi:hypothetical protein
MDKNRVVIVVAGGVVQQVIADRPEELEIVIRDEDNAEAGGEIESPAMAEPLAEYE